MAQVQELEDELEDMRSQIKKLQDTLEQETLTKVDFQNQIQSLKEDTAFRKKMYEEVGWLIDDSNYPPTFELLWACFVECQEANNCNS